MAREHVVIVGAGMAGLTAALELARRGLEVTVLEQAMASGGKMREIAVGDARIDGGPTVFTMRWVFEAIFKAAGTTLEREITLHRASILARHAWQDGTTLDLFADQKRSSEAIAAFAGKDEAQRFDAFCAHAARTFKTLEGPFINAARPSVQGLIGQAGLRGLGDLLSIKPFETLWRALGRYFHDPRLRQLFGRYATYCGSSPFAAPATLMLVAHVEQEGVWLIEGGMHELAKTLERLAAAKGAVFRHGCEVKRILVRQGSAHGVELASGETIEADAVIANNDVAALAQGLLGQDARRAVKPEPLASRSLSAVTWACLAKPEGFPLVRHNVFFSSDYKAEFDAIFEHQRLPHEPTVYVCAQDRGDGGPAPAEPERFLCLVNAPPVGDRHPLRPSGDRPMSGANLRPSAPLRLVPRSADERGDDAQGLRPALSGDGRGALRPQRPRLESVVRETDGAQSDQGALSGGRQRPSGSGRADGGPLGPDGGKLPYLGLRFNEPVARNGYSWWYVDGLSDDGSQGITLIAFIGSVFSPLLRLCKASRRGRARRSLRAQRGALRQGAAVSPATGP